jgi:hypothetical protein
VAEPRPIFVTLTGHERDSHEWVSRAGGLWRFGLFEVQVNGRPNSGTRFAYLVTDLDDEPGEP